VLDEGNAVDGRVRVVNHLRPHHDDEELQAIRAGLLATPKTIDPKHFYDETGSRLFDEITELEEYYQTRTERSILEAVADDVIARTGARELLELGSGTSTKTRVLLDAMSRAGTLRRYLPFDVSEEVMREAAHWLVSAYPGLEVDAVVGDFHENLDAIPEGDHRLVIFLGGTIGNFDPDRADRFLGEVAAGMRPGDHLLLGTDLIKDVAVIERAYNDARGLTAEFNRNILRVLGTKLDADLVPDRFEHRAFYDVARHRIEMWLRARETHTVFARRLGEEIAFEEGEEILTEISTKYDRPLVQGLLDRADLDLSHWYTDPDRMFALTLARRR
jgi:L-histidine N-alpha-methyltransferase